MSFYSKEGRRGEGEAASKVLANFFQNLSETQIREQSGAWMRKGEGLWRQSKVGTKNHERLWACRLAKWKENRANW